MTSGTRSEDLRLFLCSQASFVSLPTAFVRNVGSLTHGGSLFSGPTRAGAQVGRADRGGLEGLMKAVESAFVARTTPESRLFSCPLKNVVC